MHFEKFVKVPTAGEGIAIHFAMDVMNRWKQHIVILRECVSSYTLTCFADSEKAKDLVNAILVLCAEVRNLSGITTIRIDPAPGFVASINDPNLKRLNIILEKGREKNVNKNPIAEKAVGELGTEILRMSPDGGPLPRVTLALATASLNSRIRRDGLSAREIWTQRDQFTGAQLPFEDRDIVKRQFEARLGNHGPSAKAKAPKAIHPAPNLGLCPGDLVLLRHEHDKTKARDKYMIASVNGTNCKLRKFTKDQFRSKLYDVKISDCVPLTPPREQYPTIDSHESERDVNISCPLEEPYANSDTDHQEVVVDPNVHQPPDILPPPAIIPVRDKEELSQGSSTVTPSPLVLPPEIITVPEADSPARVDTHVDNEMIKPSSGRPQRNRSRPAKLNDYEVRIEQISAFDIGDF